MTDNKKQTLEKINIITLGDSSVGKSCFILRYTDHLFESSHLTTLGIDYKTKIVELPNKKKIHINFFDTAGQERYKSISVNTIKKANGVLLMYDITNKDTFESISNWMDNIIIQKGKEFPIILLGNKCDLEDKRKVTKNEGEEFAKKYNLSFFETSNKTGLNVEEASLKLVNLILEKKDKVNELLNDYEIPNDRIILDVKKIKKKKKKCNC